MLKKLAGIPVYLKIIYGAILAVALLLGYQAWTGHRAAGALVAAPLNNSTGPDDAAVTIVEFIDYRCSFCRDMHPVVKQVAAGNPDVRIVYRHLPAFGLQSIIEAQFALAAGMQGQFEDVHDYLMNQARPLNEDNVPALAAEFGLDEGQLLADMKGPEIGNMLLENVAAAERLGINVTPTFMINRRIIKPNELGRLPDEEDFARFIAEAR